MEKCGFCSLMFWYHFASIKRNIIVPDTECQYPDSPDPRLERLESCTKCFVYKILCVTHAFLNVFVDPAVREASHIDFDHEKCHMDVGGGGGWCL